MTIYHDHDPDHCRHVMLYYATVAEQLETAAERVTGADLRWELAAIANRCWHRGGAYAIMSCPHYDFDRREFHPEITKM